MRCEFTAPKNRGGSPPPSDLLAEAEIVFDDMTVGDGGRPVPSPFAHLKLVGFSVWQGDRDVYVTLPGRAFGAGSDRAYFDYVRVANRSESARESLYRIKRWIIDRYKEWAIAARVAVAEEGR